MADDTYVQSIRYELDIADVQRKFGDLDGDQNTFESNTDTNTNKISKHWDRVGGAVKTVGLAIGGLALGAVAMAPKILESGAALEAMDAKASTVFSGSSLAVVNEWATANARAMGLTQTQAVDTAASMADLLKPMGFTAEQAAGMSTEMVGLSGALSAWSGGQYSAKEAADIMSAAMLGETDSLKGLGISISAADIEARLAANGQSELTGAALEQAKAIATQQLILEQSTDAQTAWGDGSMDAAKKQNEMKAATAGVGESLTRALYPALEGILPVVTTFATWFGEHAPAAIATLREAIGNVSDWFSQHKGVMIAAAIGLGVVIVGLFTAWAVAAGAAALATLAAAAPFIAIGAAVAAVAAAVVYAYQNFEGFRTVVDTVKEFIVNELVPAFQAIWSFISDNIIPIIQTLIKVYLKALVAYFGVVKTIIMDGVVPALTAIVSTIVTVATGVGTAIGTIVGFVTGVPGRIFGVAYSMFDQIKESMTTAKDWVSDRIDDVVGFATGLPGRMVGLFSGMWDGIKSAFRSAINWVIDAWNGLEFKVPGVSAFGVSVGGFTIGVPDIARLANGGLAFGPTLAIVGDNRNARTDPEVIAPLSKLTAMLSSQGGGRGGINIHGDVIVRDERSMRIELESMLWTAGAR